MIKSNELRVGNWFFDGGDEQSYFQIEWFEKEFAVYRNGSAKMRIDYDLFEPIPLTEEWLIKFGFEKTYDEFVYDKANLRIEYIIWADDEPEWKLKRFYGNTFSSHSTIKTNYVHQLQNLYFALTNEELTITQ